MTEDTDAAALGQNISQEAARELLEAAKEAVVHLREMKAAHGALFQADKELEMLVAAILKAEQR